MRKRIFERAHPAIVRLQQRRVRFEEVDQICFMWHGRYASWLEDGREDLGDSYGIGYMDFYDCGVAIPLKTFALDFHAPLRYKECYTLETSLLWNDAAVLEYQYRIFDKENVCVTSATTTQLMIDTSGKLLLDAPQFYKEFCARWAAGEFANAYNKYETYAAHKDIPQEHTIQTNTTLAPNTAEQASLSSLPTFSTAPFRRSKHDK